LLKNRLNVTQNEVPINPQLLVNCF
jgi:hypothetical protein